jgi:cupin fold WbuC family metalloprotein
VTILRGRVEEILYDDEGREVERIMLSPGAIVPGSVAAMHIPKGQYHTCRSLESGTVIIEFKNTKFDLSGTERLEG